MRKRGQGAICFFASQRQVVPVLLSTELAEEKPVPNLSPEEGDLPDNLQLSPGHAGNQPTEPESMPCPYMCCPAGMHQPGLQSARYRSRRARRERGQRRFIQPQRRKITGTRGPPCLHVSRPRAGSTVQREIVIPPRTDGRWAETSSSTTQLLQELLTLLAECLARFDCSTCAPSVSPSVQVFSQRHT